MLSLKTRKDNPLDINKCVGFQLIEKVKVYNKGKFLEEYTRFEGEKPYIYFPDSCIKNLELTDDINDMSLFTKDDDPNVVLACLVKKIREGNLLYEGIVVIDFDELQNITSHVLHYPNNRYKDGYCPIKILDDKGEAYYKAYELQQLELHMLYVKELEAYLLQKGISLTDGDYEYISLLSNNELRRLFMINRGRNNFVRLK